MKERPIGILVEALRSLGAEINYLEKEGFPPLKIHGKHLEGGTVNLDAGISSQFISSLMLIGPVLKNGIEINFDSIPVSLPYILMTSSLMRQCGAEARVVENTINVLPKNYQPAEIICENDWSAASYFYSIVAIDSSMKLILPGLKSDSIQGDSVLKDIYSQFGIETLFKDNEIEIFNNKDVFCDYFEYDFTDCPDLAQTLAFTCCALRIPGKLTGLSTLKNKETDRILALKNEMEKCGMKIEITDDSLKFSPENELPDEIEFKTYDDHRMAMAAVVMSLVGEKITIENKNVVTKSFPKFWEECGKIFLVG
jgi:3-phosphoshikimate 1-carboxyvinyltransferase